MKTRISHITPNNDRIYFNMIYRGHVVAFAEYAISSDNTYHITSMILTLDRSFLRRLFLEEIEEELYTIHSISSKLSRKAYIENLKKNINYLTLVGEDDES